MFRCRERNKILARRSRIKKKKEVEYLKAQIGLYQLENDSLKRMIQRQRELLLKREMLEHESQAAEDAFPSDLISRHVLMDPRPEVAAMMERLNILESSGVANLVQSTHCVIDSEPENFKVIDVADNFFEVTGYSREEMLGKQCSILQGPDTNTADAARILEDLRESRPVEIVILSYRKSGDSFWNFVQARILSKRSASSTDSPQFVLVFSHVKVI